MAKQRAGLGISLQTQSQHWRGAGLRAGDLGSMIFPGDVGVGVGVPVLTKIETFKEKTAALTVEFQELWGTVELYPPAS